MRHYGSGERGEEGGVRLNTRDDTQVYRFSKVL